MRKTGIRVFALILMVMMAFVMMPHMEAHASGYPNTPSDGIHQHTFPTNIRTKEPDCTNHGTLYRICSLCGVREDETIAPLGHTYSDTWRVTTPATCFVAGVETRHCSRCGEPETRAIKQLTHSYPDKWTVVTPASCGVAGSENRFCEYCGTPETRAIKALEHAYGPEKVTVPATCTTDGAKTQTCSLCGDVKTFIIKSEGHSFSAWTQTKAPTCTAEGEETRTCSIDNVVEKRPVKANGHSFSTWTQTKAPSCTTAGEEQRTCSVDNVVEKRAIPADGHKFGPWVQTKAPSCDEKGEEIRTCSVDNVVEKRELARLKHVPSHMWYALRKPSLTEPGIKYRVCDLCGKRLDSVEYGPEGYRYGLIALNFGPYVKDLKPQELATFADRFTPLDLSQDGETQWPIITQDAYYIGMIKLNVLQDTLTVTYVMNDPATVVTNELLFLRDDAMAVTAADLNDVSTTYKFGEVIPLAGQTDRVLNVRIVANYDRDNKANRPFSDNGLYLDGMTQNAQLLQDMTLKLTAVSAQ